GASRCVLSHSPRNATPDIAQSTAWFNGATIPSDVIRYGAAQCPEQPDSFYVISGYDLYFYQVSAVTWRYDALTNTWNELAPFPVAVESPAATCYQGHLYVMGGDGTNQFFIYNIATDTWSSGPPLPRGVFGAAAGAWNGKIYLAGGSSNFDPENVTHQVDIYDIASATWSTAPNTMPVATGLAGVAQAGPELYIVGGFSTNSPERNVRAMQRLNMETGTWQQGAALPAGRGDFALAATDTALYAIGGDTDGGSFFDLSDNVLRLERTQFASGTWAELPEPLPIRVQSKGFCTSAVTGGEIWSTGSWRGHNFFRSLSGERCASPYSDVPWLSTTPDAGTVAADRSRTLTVQVDAGNLDVGTHTATLVLPVSDGGVTQLVLPVTVEVLAGHTALQMSAGAEQTAVPGSISIHTILITNIGDTTVTPILSMQGNTWKTSLLDNAGTLAPGQSTVVEVAVQVPADALVGARDTVQIVAANRDGATLANASLTTTAGAFYGILVGPSAASTRGTPGLSVAYTLEVYNTGTTPDTFTVQVSNATWTTTAPAQVGPVAPGGRASVEVVVLIPLTVHGTATDAAEVRVTSQGDPTQQSSAILTTGVAHVSQLITPAGGTLAAPGFEVVVPSNGVSGDTMLLYTPLITPTVNLPTVYSFERAFVFEAILAGGVALADVTQPYEMTISYDDPTLADNAVLLIWDGQAWVDAVMACADIGCTVVERTSTSLTVRALQSGEFILARQSGGGVSQVNRVYMPRVVR
ncbi:MAG: hypothetical protein HC914_21260, partial [Chloroflexaceae bacterium]|nr:hypothetical protein [Chloroflexaceae bacterium]